MNGMKVLGIALLVLSVPLWLISGVLLLLALVGGVVCLAIGINQDRQDRRAQTPLALVCTQCRMPQFVPADYNVYRCRNCGGSLVHAQQYLPPLPPAY